jgi:hypothetical protein
MDCFLQPATAAIGGLSAERLAKTDGRRSKDSVNIAAGMGGPPVAMEMACRQDITQSCTQNGKI